MSMDPNRWINTIPFIGTTSNQEKYKLDSNRWVNTLPTYNNPTYSKKNGDSSTKKYPLVITLFVVGLIVVSVIKNETRNIEKEINNLRASINSLNFSLYQSTLDHEVITSPENITYLAKKYLVNDFVYYEKSQIKRFNEEVKILTKLEETRHKKIINKKKEPTDEIKLRVAKKIKTTKTELRKFQDLYSQPKQLPSQIKLKVAKKIQTKKKDLKNLYSNPYDLIKSKKAQKWAGLQVVKVFLGIPIVPGK